MDEYISNASDSNCSGEPGGFSAFIERVGGDIELARDMARLFVPDGAQLLARIEEAFAANDITGLTDAAHALKGAASNFSTAGATSVAAEIEQLCRTGDLELAIPLRARIAQEGERLLAAVRNFVQDEVCAS